MNPPNGASDTKYLAPPLGLLTLAAEVRKEGHETSLIDFNLEVLMDSRRGGLQFYEFATKVIASESPDVVCLTSMCLESHVSIELAKEIKSASPNTFTVMGGTHFGAIAREALEKYAFLDCVVSGEAEDSLVQFLRWISDDELTLPGNVWYRANDKILHGAAPPVNRTLEELPFPAYDLVDLERYFVLNPDRLLNYEAGRGCVFKCSFCYSPFQYGDSVRNKAPRSVVEDLRKLTSLGAQHIFFVQDNFLNTPRWATELCTEIASADLPLTWECYATYPQLKEPLIDAMAAAGCRGVFTGIDAVTPDAQVAMNKSFLKDWNPVAKKLSYCREKGILPICAFILEGPRERQESIDATIKTAVNCLALGCEIHINTLSIYNGSLLAKLTRRDSHRYSAIKAELLFDTPEVVQVNEYAKISPSLFPYHSTEHAIEEWETFTAKAFTVWAVLIAFPKTSRQYVQEGGSIWEAMRYVSTDTVALLRKTPAPQRRLSALLQFADNMRKLPLSPQTASCLELELAQVELASHELPRFVSIRIGKSVKDYILAWFVFLRLGIEDDSESSIMLDSFMGSLNPLSSGPPSTSSIKPNLALRSQRDTVCFFAVEQTDLALLAQLDRASISQKPLNVTMECGLRLLNNKWIWPVDSGEFSASRLGNQAVAA